MTGNARSDTSRKYQCRHGAMQRPATPTFHPPLDLHRDLRTAEGQKPRRLPVLTRSAAWAKQPAARWTRARWSSAVVCSQPRPCRLGLNLETVQVGQLGGQGDPGVDALVHLSD